MSTAPMQFTPMLTDEDRARGDYYALLARLYFDAPDQALLNLMAGSAAIDDAPTALPQAWSMLRSAAAAADVQAVRVEYDELFIGTGKALVTPYGSNYLSDSTKEKVLVRLRSQLAATGLARVDASGVYEDHIAGLSEVMRHLIFQGSADGALQQQKQFFFDYIRPWYGQLTDNVIACNQSNFYKHVARFSKAFFDVEAEALSMI